MTVKKISEILNEVERFETEEQWINYGIGLVNVKCKEASIEPFPLYDASQAQEHGLDNATEFAEAIIAEWKRIQESTDPYEDPESGEKIKKLTYRSPIEGEFKVEEKMEETSFDGLIQRQWRYYIHFTGAAYKTLNGRNYLRLPFQTAASFMNNILSSDKGVRVEYGGEPHTVRIGGNTPKVYTISIPGGEVKDE